MRKTNFLFAAMIVAGTVAAQPTLLYKKAFGGTWYDYASQVKATPDGGMVLIGTALSTNGDVVGSHGNVDAFVVKLNAAGTLDWKHAYGGTGYDGGTAITPTADGGYIFGGFSQSNDFDVPSTNSTMDNNCWFVKLDASGNVQWKKTYGGSNNDNVINVLQLADGSYIAAASTRSTDGDVTNPRGLDDCWLLKLDASGNLQWQKTYGGSSYDQLSQLILTNDGGFAFTALTYSTDGDITSSHGGYEIWMVKLDVSGTIQWQRCYGGSLYEYSRGLLQTATGDYVLLGQWPSKDGDGAFTDTTDIGGVWVVKIDNTGNLLWENQYGGTVMETAAGLTLDSLGRYVIAASSNSNDGDVTGHHGTSGTDYWVFCLDPSGTLVWQRSFGGIDNEDASSIALLNDGSLAVLGTAYSNNNGDVQGSGYHWGTETINPPNSPSFTVNTGDYWVIKISSPLSTTGIHEPAASIDFGLAPNPASASFTVSAEDVTKITVTDMHGRLVYESEAVQKTVNVEGWAPGMYFVSVCTGKGTATQKLVIAGQ